MSPLVDVRNLVKEFPARGARWPSDARIRAVDDVSFAIEEGETFGLVGESGSGKTTTGRCILRLVTPTSGDVRFRGEDVLAASPSRLRELRRQMQIVFQDPYSSLNPRMRVGAIVEEPLVIHGVGNRAARRARVEDLFRLVGLDRGSMRQYPHEFSGGQRQRIGLARSLALNPDLIVCDEPISALDVSIQAQVINLLEDLQQKLGLTYLFIAHDLSAVRHISTRVAVMYLGIIVELAGQDDLYTHPLHPYTQALLSAVPIPDPLIEEKRQRMILTGDVPSPVNPPSGCRFRTRCPLAAAICAEKRPDWREISSGHFVACHMV